MAFYPEGNLSTRLHVTPISCKLRLPTACFRGQVVVGPTQRNKKEKKELKLSVSREVSLAVIKGRKDLQHLENARGSIQ